MNKKVKLDTEKLYQVRIAGLSHDGRGITTIQEKKTFVAGALPEEEVNCRLLKKRSTYNDASCDSVLASPSPLRVPPPCDHFGTCGGCNLQHMALDLQLKIKQQTLLEQLQHFGKVIPESILPPLHAESIGYRHKARLGVRFVYKKNKLLIGFREKAGRYLADIHRCPVLHPAVGDNLSALAECLTSLSLREHIPQIEVAIGDDACALIVRHMQEFNAKDQQKLIEFSQKHRYHLYLQPNPPAQVHKLWPKDSDERLSFSLPEHQLKFRFHPLDFTQINLALNQLMVNQAVKLLDIGTQEEALDLFCGIGNFSLSIARYAKSVVGVEGSTDMVARAMENAAYNNIRNVSFYASNLMEPIKDAPWLKAYDKLLLDPPRTGAKELLPAIPVFAPKRIVYVSCNPATLARDAQELVHQYGYHLIAAGIMNMFPHTAHIEAMAVFEK